MPALALVALALATLVGALVYPTYANYDSAYSLLWGRELLHGTTPSFETYRAPTEHPLAIFIGAFLALFGNGADRALVLLTLASFVGLAAGLYRLTRVSFGWVVGLIAAALLCTRFDFPFLAARAYIDIPYLAFVIWAAALEAERPRRGMPVLVLLALAAMMRPESWLLIGLYFLWVAWPASWPNRVRFAAVTALGPLVWVGLDFAVTGQPLFSLQHTSGLAEELGRSASSFGQIPSASTRFLKNLTKIPVFYAGLVGLGLAVYLTPRRAVMPLVLLGVGLGTFVLVGLAGLSLIDRYLLVPSLMIMVLAAVTLGGWSLLTPGRLRTAWTVGAVLLVGYGAIFTATRVNFHVFDTELRFRGDAHASLEQILNDPEVKKLRSCGPISVPTHKLVPDVRWISDRGADEVIARSDPDPAAQRRTQQGLALVTASKGALNRQVLTSDTVIDPADTARILSAPLSFRFVATSPDYAIYSSC